VRVKKKRKKEEKVLSDEISSHAHTHGERERKRKVSPYAVCVHFRFVNREKNKRVKKKRTTHRHGATGGTLRLDFQSRAPARDALKEQQ
jgi:hypothetical protein